MIQFRSLGVILIALSLALFVGCGQPQPTATPPAAAPTAAVTGAQVGSSATPTAATSAPTTAAKSATTAPTAMTAGETVGEVEDIALSEKVKTYRESMHVVSRLDNVVQWEWYTTVEFNREQPATRSVISGTSEGGELISMELVRIGSDSYTRIGDTWMTATDQEDPLESVTGLIAWADPRNWGDDQNCTYKGKETVNGEITKHWNCDTDALSAWGVTGILGTLEEGRVDSWISTEYNVTVRTVADWRGKDADGKVVTFAAESNVTDINKPLEIKPPEGVTMSGLPEDIPLIEGGTEVMSMAGIVSFKVAGSVDDVTAFYAGAMDHNGWKTGEGSGVRGMLSFAKDGRTAQIMIAEDGANTQVTIVVQNK